MFGQLARLPSSRRIAAALARSTIFIPFCYVEAAANPLTNPALRPYGKIPKFKYCAVRLERGGEAAGEIVPQAQFG
jgi:formate dehydrogenase major subunit